MEYAVAYCADIQCAVGSFGHSVYAAELQFAVYFGTQSARKAILDAENKMILCKNQSSAMMWLPNALMCQYRRQPPRS